MDCINTVDAKLAGMIASDGRRERKKAQTRARIQDAALDLFASQGYRETTIAQIAARADVATRTVTLHFPAKDDLLFADDPFTPESLEARLRDRKPRSTLDAVRDWMHATMRELDERDRESGVDPAHIWQRRALRADLLLADDDLRGRARAGYRDLELPIAAALGADLGLPADALLPRLTAVTVVAGLREIYVTREGRARTSDLGGLVDDVLAFAEAGLRATPA